MLTLIWRESARQDIKAAIDYIAENNAAAADRMLLAIEACAERLSEHPLMYRTGRVHGTREAVVHPNYILIYRLTMDAVEIVKLVHSRQKYP